MLRDTSKPLKMYVKITNINLLTEIITHSWGIYTKIKPGMETVRSLIETKHTWSTDFGIVDECWL